MMSVRVVLDTNVLVAAGFRASSASGRLVALVRDGRFAVVWHPDTIAETRHILGRIPRLGWAPAADLFTEAGRVDTPLDRDRFAVVPDPADRKFAALAAVAGVPLVSADDDLLGVRAALADLGVEVLRPNALLARLPSPT